MRNMASSLRSALNKLASNFASTVLDAIRGASLEELRTETGGVARRGPGRPPNATTNDDSKVAKSSGRRSGRLKRRSPKEIAKALDQVVALLRKNKEGLRAEEIRANLGMDRKEMPRVLKEGLAKRKLKSKGRKRATTYTAT